ncbi:MAG: NADH-quinone oxidoreductase subunit L [Deltaproteobacteria bacterium]
MAPQSLALIPLLPLLGAIVCGTLGPRLGRENVGVIASGMVLGAFGLSLAALAAIWSGADLSLSGAWFSVGAIHVGSGLVVDRLTSVMLLVVTGVGFLIHVYSTGYIADDPAPWRFFAYLNLFVAAMLVLVLADNLVLLFVGWEGVGLCSYLLIGFWYEDEKNAQAGKKAFVVNRIGELGFTLGVLALLALFGTVLFGALGSAAAGLEPGTLLHHGVFAGWTVGGALGLVCLLFVLGVTGKSAQLPLYVWLPDAMAGPTPVSALIHAATMVTAGVYLMCRLSFLFALSPLAMLVVALVGAATAAFAAVIAFAQNDIKKVLAYSTVSQLGYMVLAVGVGAFWAAIFHLVAHACFKALLFLGAGSVIHGLHGEQDMRKMGGLGKRLPQTAVAFAVATVAITGVLPLSGFFSKDTILGLALGTANHAYPWAPGLLYGVGTAAALGTGFYMWRLYALTFTGAPRSEAAAHGHEAPASMTLVTWALALASIVTLVLGLPLEGGAPLERWLEPVFSQATHAFPALVPAVERGVPWLLYGIAISVAWAGLGLAWLLYAGPGTALPERLADGAPWAYALVRDKFYVDELYDRAVVRPLFGGARLAWRVLDAGLIDTVLVRGAGFVARAFSEHVLRPLQNGNAQRYATAMALGAAAMLWLLLR